MKTFNLPKDHRPYIDKYFLRAKEILYKDLLNPTVRAQVFIRRGNCKVHGMDEAIAILTTYGKDVKIWALKEGDHFAPSETLMIIEAPIQEIIDLETMYLGVLSAETTIENGDEPVNLTQVEKNMKRIVDLVAPRPVSYFGARHWRWDADASIAEACFKAGADSCSTDIGAETVDKKGIGTIPHALETIYHWRDGPENAVFSATQAFDEHIDQAIPRIALVDYANKEISDSLNIAPMVDGIRIDTCGENYMQGVMGIHENTGPLGFMRTCGVSINGVYLIRKLLNDSGFGKVKIILSSGFGKPEKVKLFLGAEELLGMKLFDSLGVGGVYESRMATMDIIEVAGKTIHKVGRVPRPNERLRRVI